MHVETIRSCLLVTFAVFGLLVPAAWADSDVPERADALQAKEPARAERPVEARQTGAQAGRVIPAQTLTQPTLRAAPRESEADSWRWVPGRYAEVPSGVWVSHPPVEMAIDLLGPDAVQQCVQALGKPSTGQALACAVEIAPCQRLVLPTRGRLRMELDTACYRGERPTPGWRVEPQQVEEADKGAPMRGPGT